MRTLAMVILFPLLVACSGQPTVVNPNKTAVAAQGDYDQCRGRAAIAAAQAPKGTDPETLRQKILDECMKEKGYIVR